MYNKNKIDSKLNSKFKESSQSDFNNCNKSNMKIQTFKQINSAITKTFIEEKCQKIREELDDLENIEISEIISKLQKNKKEKKKDKNDDNIKSKKNKLSKIKILKLKNDYMNNLEEDKFQKKYRKLYLNKNLYDSLDDEEIIDEETIYHFYISPNSLTVYILDFLVLIFSFIELYYLPIYISSDISSFSIFGHIITSIVFSIIDFIYVIDLITGFFRAYYNFEEILIKRNLDICLNYLTGWFLLDLIEAMPYLSLLKLE